MSIKELIRLRLLNQKLSSTGFESPVDVVSHFGAMQAQDYPMAKWAIGLRMKHGTDHIVENAIQSGEIIRTHILRPTWHFVSRNDVRWMMQLSAPYIKKATQYVDKQVGLTDTLFKKAWKIIEPQFKHEDSLTKENIISVLAAHKVKMDNLLATQFIIRAEVEMLLCNGIRNTKDTAYALFEKIVPAATRISKEEAIAKLAFTYFNSRGPATAADFKWWSGLNSADAKLATSALSKNLLRATVNGLDFFYFQPATKTSNKLTSVLLPPFDEYMVGYVAGRDIVFSGNNVDKSAIGNGIFKPIVLMDNAIAGIWKKIKKNPFAEMQALNTGNEVLQKKMIQPLKQFELFNKS